MPVVILAGAGDQVVNPEIHTRPLHAAVPGSVLRLLPGAGHQIQYTRTADVLAARDEAERMAKANSAR